MRFSQATFSAGLEVPGFRVTLRRLLLARCVQTIHPRRVDPASSVFAHTCLTRERRAAGGAGAVVGITLPLPNEATRG